MSFKSILSTIGKTIFGIEHAVAPIAAAILPQYSGPIVTLDKLFSSLQTAILTVEANAPTAEGKVKSEAVIADFQASLEVAANVAEAAGQELVYDKVALQQAIDAQVQALNFMATVKASIKMAPKGTPVKP